MAAKSKPITFRCPQDLLDKLIEAAGTDSPATKTLSREIVERLFASFRFDEKAAELTDRFEAETATIVSGFRERAAAAEASLKVWEDNYANLEKRVEERFAVLEGKK